MDNLSLLEKAAAYFNKKEFTSATECLCTILESDPHNVDALLGMAAINDALGRENCNNWDYKKAITYFIKALEYDPEDEYANKWLSKLERPVSIVIDISARQKVEHSNTIIKIDGNDAVDNTKGERISIFCLPGQHRAAINTQSQKFEVTFFVPASKKLQYYQLDYSDDRFQFLHVLDNLSVGYSSKPLESKLDLFEDSEDSKSSKQKRRKNATFFIAIGALAILSVLCAVLVKYSPVSIPYSNIESLSAVNASSPTVRNTNMDIVVSDQSASLENTCEPADQSVSAIGLWTYYGLYPEWENESILTNAIPDDQLTEINYDNSIALSIDSECFQYYDSIGTWTQAGNDMHLYGDDLVNAGDFFIVDRNTLHESIRGDIVV
jgi:hypothetical protein